jgi:hypothetical protein
MPLAKRLLIQFIQRNMLVVLTDPDGDDIVCEHLGILPNDPDLLLYLEGLQNAAQDYNQQIADTGFDF